MRIVIDARESGTTTGRYVDKLIEHMHKLRPKFEIIVLVKSHRLNFMEQLAPRFNIIKSDYKEFGFSEQLGLLHQLNSLKPDLVHFTMTQQPVLFRGLAVTTIHDLTTARYNNPNKNWLVFKFKQTVYKRVIKRVARTSAAIITPSDWVKYDVVKFAHIRPIKISVIHEAAEEINSRPEPVKSLVGEKFIMYVGRPAAHKNLKRLIRAFGLVRLNHSGLKLALVGKLDANYEALRKYAHRQDITGIVYTNFVSEAQLRWLYEHASAYVFPSLSEGFGLPGLEAMAHELPVVSSNATCLPEIYGRAALFFDPTSASDIAEKINQVLTDHDLALKLRQVGKQQAGKYSWEKTAQQTLDVYRKALRLT